MEDALMNLVSATAAQDVALTKLTTEKGNLYTQLRQKEYRILELQSELCNIKVAAATKTTNMKGYNKGVNKYARKK